MAIMVGNARARRKFTPITNRDQGSRVMKATPFDEIDRTVVEKIPIRSELSGRCRVQALGRCRARRPDGPPGPGVHRRCANDYDDEDETKKLVE